MTDNRQQNIEELLLNGTPVQFFPRGWSMYPLIVPGRDQVVVEPVTDPDTLRRGDVCVYRRAGSILVIHRIWKKNRRGIWFVGDNQHEVEGPLSPSQIRGKMTAVIRKGRRISVSSPWYRTAAGLWLWLRPIRPYLSHAAHFLKRISEGRH